MKTVIRTTILTSIISAALAGSALAATGNMNGTSESTATKSGHAVINFANLPHRIDSWRADGTKGIYLRVGIKQWYYAAFMGQCTELPFRERIGIVSDGLGQIDRFSSIVLGGPGGLQRCWFKSVDKVKGPPGKADSNAS